MAVVVLLTVFTASYYLVYWLFRETKVLNKRLPGRSISAGFVALCVVLSFLSLVVWSRSLLGGIEEHNFLESFLESLYLGLLVIWTFRIRNRLNFLLQARRREPAWCRAPLTWFFQAIYLQWKINRNLEALNSEPTVPRLWDPRRYRFGFWRWTAVGVLPLLPATVIGTIVVLAGTASLVARGFHRSARNALERTLGPLEPERFEVGVDCPSPVALGDRALELRLAEDEVSFLKELVGTATLSEPRDLRAELGTIIGRNETVLARFREDLDTEPLCLDLDSGRDGYSHQGRLLRLEYLRALLALREGDAESALATVRHAGRYARLLEEAPGLGPHIFGLFAERLQLWLIHHLSNSGLVGTVRLSELVDDLSDADLEGSLGSAMAQESFLLESAIRDEEQDDGDEWLATRMKEAFLYYSVSGAHEWNLRYAESYGASYADQKRRLDYDPESMGFLEKVRIVGSLRDWSLPSRYRVVGDARELTRFYLTQLGGRHDGESGCDSLGPVPPPLAGRLSLEPLETGGCALLYLPLEEYDAVLGRAWPNELEPPLRWALPPRQG